MRRFKLAQGLWPRGGGEHSRLLVFIISLALLVVIAAPFAFVPPDNVRGVPGPLLIVVALAASLLLGPYLGVALMVVAVLLGIGIIDENPVSEPLVWIPAALLAGLLGERLARDERAREQMLAELRAGLVALTDLSTLGALSVVTQYVPAERAQVLAADFYGVLVTPEGELAVMVGDVAGHGPRAAAVAAHLRAGWRALVSAGVSQHEIVKILDQTLQAEKQRIDNDDLGFASLCLARISSNYSEAQIVVAGHPPPIFIGDGAPRLCELEPGPLIGLGIGDTGGWQPQTVDLPDALWTLLLYTDGLVEGRAPNGRRPLGPEAVLRYLGNGRTVLGGDDVAALMDFVTGSNQGPLPDDVVIVSVSRATLTPAPAALATR